jgi:hypothetical protein
VLFAAGYNFRRLLAWLAAFLRALIPAWRATLQQGTTRAGAKT